jgi:hypothetical protein
MQALQTRYFLPPLFVLTLAPSWLMAAASRPPSYFDDIKPILAIHCIRCHGPETQKSGLRLDQREAVFAKGESGLVPIVAGDMRNSEILRRITSNDADEIMPQKSERLPPADVERIRAWIAAGAQWPAADDYWAFRPVTAPAIPPIDRPNPIDRFIESRLTTEKIAPAPPADARTLLRRAFADLLGVPPSPAEADAFLNDKSPDAFEKLIDRLLADPRYGERWARHWLDLVRYSESDGFEDDRIRPLAWRYRDYVIRSLNADKPYDRFVQEQIAGDELWPNDPNAIVATGFARLGMWDGMSKEPERQRHAFLNDATDAVGSVFLGVTIGCARCHDHKYDAITQRDYYGLKAFFAGIKREKRDLGPTVADPPHVVAARNDAESALAKVRQGRDVLLRNARLEVEWDHRCDVDEKGNLIISEDQIRKEAERRSPKRVGELDASIRKLDSAARQYRLSAEAAIETSAAAPPATLLLKGGELSRPGPEVPPAFIAAMVPAGRAQAAIAPRRDSPGSGRRTALAHWLTAPENPLTARVIVNRLWQHHFGVGIVATPSDFGRHGQPPTHPELLDWLASQFVRSTGFQPVNDGSKHGLGARATVPWSHKAMHRLMMTSAAYRRSSTVASAPPPNDPQNHLLWQANRRRLEGEAIRDSILTVSGQLSPVRGGPGVYPRISKDVNVELPNNDKALSWYPCTDEENRRRSIYIFQRRSLTFPLFDVFDGAAMSQSCPVRGHTTVAPQALTLLNGEFAREQARHLAERVRRESAPTVDGGDSTIVLAYRLAFIRTPSADELIATRAFLHSQSQLREKTQRLPAAKADLAAFEDFCHVLLNANEFIYLD